MPDTFLQDYLLFHIKSKVFHRIIIGNTFHDLLKYFIISRVLSVLYPSSDEFTENSSEVLMSCIRQESVSIPTKLDRSPKFARDVI